MSDSQLQWFWDAWHRFHVELTHEIRENASMIALIAMIAIVLLINKWRQ